MEKKIRCKYGFPIDWEIGHVHFIKKAKESAIRPYVSRWAKKYEIELSVFKEGKQSYSITRTA